MTLKAPLLYVAGKLSPETVQSVQRKQICATCFNNVNGRCRLCGCDIDAKSKLPSHHCDDGKW